MTINTDAGTPASNGARARSTSPRSIGGPGTPHTPAAFSAARASAPFARSLRNSWLHPEHAAPLALARTLKDFRHGQTSTRQEELRSDLVFVALQHDAGSRSSEHVATICRYVCGAPDVAFAVSMPPQLLRRVCAAAQMRLVQDGEVLFAAGEPASSLHVILSGQVKLTRNVAGETREVGTLGLSRAPDYDDFVSSYGIARRTSCTADGTVLALTLDKELYIQALLEQADDEIALRMATVASCSLFSAIPHKLKLHVAELLRPATFRHGARVAKRGSAADRLWFVRAGRMKVITTLKSPVQLHDVKIQGWGSKTSVREVDVITLQGGDVLGEESISNTNFKPTAVVHHGHHGRDQGHSLAGDAAEEEGGMAAAAAASGDGGGGGLAPAGASTDGGADKTAALEAEARIRATAVKYTHTVVAEGEVSAYELQAGDLWKVMRGASDGQRAAFTATHKAALAKRAGLHEAVVADICAVQPVVWPTAKPRPASASSLLVRSNNGRGRAGGPGQGGTSRQRPATAALKAVPGAAAARPQTAGPRVTLLKAASPPPGDRASAPSAAEKTRRQTPPTAQPSTMEERAAARELKRPASAATGARPAKGASELERREKFERPSTARSSFMRGADWARTTASEKSRAADPDAEAAMSARAGAGKDLRSLDEFMAPVIVDKKKHKKTKKLLSQSVVAVAERKQPRAAAKTDGTGRNNPFRGRRKEWAYVETMKSRREAADGATGLSGAKANEATQNVAFWPHCRFDRKTFVLDIPKPSNSEA